jgi:hypothetical protein
MFTDALSSHADLVAQRVLLATQENPATARVLVIIVLVWAVWRSWRFTIYPKLHPDEPKELPYLIPSRYPLHRISSPWLLTSCSSAG